MPDSPDRAALLAYVGASRWLRFALGVAPDEKMPEDDDAGLGAAADEFGKRAQDVPGLKIGDLLRSISRDDAARHDCSPIHVCQHSDAQHGIPQLHYFHDYNAGSARFC
jgi:hypothetical protein